MKIQKQNCVGVGSVEGGPFGGRGGFRLGGGVRVDAKCERGIDTHCLC